MKTISEYLKLARKLKKMTIDDVSRETKIKKSFVGYIENEKWHLLPEYPVVQGFVKNMADVLDLNRNEAVALLRRDYPPRDLPVNPKPDVIKEFRWSPKLTFITGIAFIILLIFGYLGYQYNQFIQPPELVVTEPTENAFVSTNTLDVKGNTDPDVTVIVNNQPAFVNEEGQFSTEIEITNQTKEITVTATSRSGKETRTSVKIDVNFN